MQSSITGVETSEVLSARSQSKLDSSGQSLLEFLLMLPLIIGLTTVMIRVNTAIQSGIVDQQYARAQALFITFNSPFYPEVDKQVGLIQSGFNQLVLGVSDNPSSAGYTPLATAVFIGRHKGIPGDDSSKAYEPSDGQPVNKRYSVRARNSVTLCTAHYSNRPGLATNLMLTGGMGSDTESTIRSVTVAGVSRLNNDFRFNYTCGSPLRYYE